MRTKACWIFIGYMTWIAPLFAQSTYFLDVTKTTFPLEKGYFKMGNTGAPEKAIEVNNQYLTLGGKPVLPIMGEMHFTRIKADQWEDCILKIKACGINILSTYLFWNHHEEIEGQFDWTGNKDLRAFIKLCRKHNLYVYPRIGPWSHGEARNGGTPDWILRKKFLKDRSNDAVYQRYVSRYIKEIARQMDGLYYKDGGNIIGIQLENEYWYAQEGESHILWLKKTAQECGIDLPLYTVTGWGGGSVPPFEVIPLWGGYADEPWIESVEKHVLPLYFQFDLFRDSKHIGNDQINRKEQYMTYEKYPFFTCEMGVGIPMMYHRRVVLSPIDGLGMMTAKLGSGSNLLGYYMFAGGTNPKGVLYPTEEEQEQTGYWSRTPAKSYDFKAAIRESGELDPSYKQIKKLHYFVNSYQETLVPMLPTIGKTKEEDLQYAVRSDGKSAFLFGINYARFVPKQERKNARFSIRFEKETIEFPQNRIDIPDSTLFIWPVNLKIGQILLKYATAQILCRTADTHLFFQNKNIPPEFAFDASTVAAVHATSGNVENKGNRIIVTNLKAGKDCRIDIRLKDGTQQQLLLLTEEQAQDSWCLERNGNKEFYISTANLYAKNDEIYALSTDNNIVVSELQSGRFIEKTFLTAKESNEIKCVLHPLFAEAKWLETADFKRIEPYQVRYRRFFFKEFSLDNPSKLRNVALYLYPETACKLHVNDKPVKQEIKEKQVNAIDISGYVQKGENMLFIDFPFIEGKAGFAGRVIAEYDNYDKIEFSTDESWLTADLYTNPTPARAFEYPHKPVVMQTPDFVKELKHNSFGEWDILVPQDLWENTNALYAHLTYSGDRAELYNGSTLCADGYNDNTPWQIGFQRLIPPAEGQKLGLLIYPLPQSEKTKMYFDIPPRAEDYDTVAVKNISVYQEYRFKIK